MDKLTQIEFVTDLCGRIVSDIVASIQEGRVPEEWNGIELRRYIAERFDGCQMGELSRADIKSYNNAIITNNL